MMLKNANRHTLTGTLVPQKDIPVLKPSRQTCRIFKIIAKIYENFLTRNSRLQKPFGG